MKATRYTQKKLHDLNFYELVQKSKARKVRDQKIRQRKEQLFLKQQKEEEKKSIN